MSEQSSFPKNSRKFTAPGTTASQPELKNDKGFSAPNTTASQQEPQNGRTFSAPSKNMWKTGSQSTGAFSSSTQSDPYRRGSGSAEQVPLKSAQRPAAQDYRQYRQQNTPTDPIGYRAQTVQEDPRAAGQAYGGEYRASQEQPYGTMSGNGSAQQPPAAGYQPPAKSNKTLLIVIIALAAALLVGLIAFFLGRGKGDSEPDEKTESTVNTEERQTVSNPVEQPENHAVEQPAVNTPAEQPAVNTPVEQPANNEVTQPETPTQASEPDFPLKKNGKSVRSASELSLYDVVTIGQYPQSSTGTYRPIEWYVINKDGNKVTLLSVYALEWRQFHGKNVQITFLNSDLYKWLNESFKSRAFTSEEYAVMASPVSLINKDDAEHLPLKYRIAAATDYVISQDENAKNCRWWVGEFSKINRVHDSYGWWWYDTRLSSDAWCVNVDGDLWQIQVDYHKGVRPSIVIQF